MFPFLRKVSQSILYVFFIAGLLLNISGCGGKPTEEDASKIEEVAAPPENTEPLAPSTPTSLNFLPAGPANNNAPTINGTTTPTAVVSVYSDNLCNSFIASGTANSSGAFSIALAVSDNSTSVVYLKSTLNGQSSACSTASPSFVEDSLAPSVPTISSSAPTSPSNSNTPTLNGSAEANSQVEVHSNSLCASLVGTGTANASGLFSVSITVGSDQPHQLFTQSVDAAGNSSGCSLISFQYVEDSTSPATPSVVSISPISPANNNSPIVSGTADPLTTLTLYSNSSCTAALGNTTSNASGNFSIGISVADNTTTAIYAAAYDLAGNYSSCSIVPLNYIEDSMAPAVPTIISATPSSPSNNNTPTISGTAEINSTVRIYTDSICTTLLQTTLTNGAGSFSTIISVLDNSLTTLYANASDLAGNISGCTLSPFQYIEDSTSPINPSLTSVSPNSPANNNSPTIEGAAEANSIVRAYSDIGCTIQIGSGTTSGLGVFQFPLAVSDNSATTIYLKSLDASNNESSCVNTAYIYVEDSLAPTLPSISSSSPASPANNNAPLILGTAEANSLVTLYSDSLCSTQIASGSANGTGAFSIGITVSDNTTTSIYARASDTAGNLSSCSSPAFVYSEVSTVPSTPVLTSTTPVSGSNNNGPLINGTADANTTVRLYSDASCTVLLASGSSSGTGAFAISISVADNSTTQVYAKSTSLGIDSLCTPTPITYVEDSLAPNAPLILASSPHSPANNNSPTLTGTAEANSSVALYSDSGCSILLASGSANGSGAFSITMTVFDNTNTNVFAHATDLAGNTSSCSSAAFVYTEDSIAPAVPNLLGTTPASPSSKINFAINGTAEANSQITVYSNVGCTTVAGTATADALGVFSVPLVSPANQSANYYARATDAAANSSACTSAFTYEHYNMAIGAGYFTGTTTTAPTTNTNMNQSSAHSIRWTFGHKDDDYYEHSLSANNHQIVVKQSGDYQVSVTLPISVAVTRASLRLRVRVNGVNTVYGISQSSFVSNSNGHRDSSHNMTVLLPGLSTNDVIDVTTQMGGNSGTVTTTGATLYIEYVAPSRSIFMASTTATQLGTNYNSTASSLVFSQQIVDSDFLHNNSSQPQNITLTTSGDYLVHFNLPLSGAVSSGAVIARIQLNGVTVAEVANGYISNANGHTSATLQWSGLLPSVSAGQVLTIQVMQDAATGTITNFSGAAGSLYIERLANQNNIVHLSGNRIVASTNWNNSTTASPIQWSNNIIKDSTNYSHSTSVNSHIITVQQEGDYWLLYNNRLTSTGTNVAPATQLYVNGSLVTSIESKTNYIRGASSHNDSSSTLSHLLRRLSAGTTIELRVFREGANGTVTAPRNANLILIKKPY